MNKQKNNGWSNCSTMRATEEFAGFWSLDYIVADPEKATVDWTAEILESCVPLELCEEVNFKEIAQRLIDEYNA